MKTYIAVFLGLMLFISIASAEDYVISNSAHGIDVISTISYANVKDLDFRFLNSPQSAQAVVLKTGTGHYILLVQSSDYAYTKTLRNDLQARLNEVELLESEDALANNLVLAQRSGAESFIIVDTTYGYNSLAVMPYAAITDSFIILADKSNAVQVASFLSGANPDWVMQYGYLDDEVKDSLLGMITETIDNNDKYQDSIEIVKKYINKDDTKQVVVTDGSFLEYGISKGEDPILLISGLIPDSIYTYIQNSEINTLILIGGDMIPAVDSMKDNLEKKGKEISVFIKFGQTTPGLTSGVQELEMFPLPSYPLDITIKSVTYNYAEKVLEVVYENKVDTVAYVQADIFIEVDDVALKTLGDSEPFMVGKSAERGQQYELDIGDLNLDEGNVYARVLAKYGATASELEKAIAGQFLITEVSYQDLSQLDITRLYYDSASKQLSLGVKNPGSVTVYYLPSFDLNTKDGLKEFSREDVLSLETGKSKDVIFSGVNLNSDEISQNKNVDIHAEYGSREEFLTKTLDKKIELEVLETGGFDYTILIIALIIVVCVLVFLLLRKKKKR